MNKSLAQSRVAEVLLVEDNEDDVFLIREAFEAVKFRVNLHHVNDGEKCLKFLRNQGDYVAAPSPDVILLDLHMPLMDGREVLAEIVKDEKLKHLPVIVLTTSHEAKDIERMYSLRCNSYITKPVDFNNFVTAVSQIAGYWLTLVVLPDAAKHSDGA
ncbi:MAG TPA: response regulator [Polaromonas sp.]|uniref:response regulator n=1 Tax=Polaromonas sp. TaxID=1869339 RepID=UPI002D558AC0|nr:response regulator [Polaromonas sp.]HYW58858.1 response regulator [Polaromonas sp.]